MTLQEYRDRVIELAITSVDRLERKEYRRRGCLRGLAACREFINAEQFANELFLRERMQEELKAGIRAGSVTLEEFWEFRCGTAQIDFVFSRMKIAYGCPGRHSVAALKQYVEITGKLPFVEALG